MDQQPVSYHDRCPSLSPDPRWFPPNQNSLPQVKTSCIRTEERWRYAVHGVHHGEGKIQVQVGDGERTRFRCRGKRKMVSSCISLGGTLVIQDQPDGSRILLKQSGVSLLPDDPLKVRVYVFNVCASLVCFIWAVVSVCVHLGAESTLAAGDDSSECHTRGQKRCRALPTYGASGTHPTYPSTGGASASHELHLPPSPTHRFHGRWASKGT